MPRRLEARPRRVVRRIGTDLEHDRRELRPADAIDDRAQERVAGPAVAAARHDLVRGGCRQHEQAATLPAQDPDPVEHRGRPARHHARIAARPCRSQRGMQPEPPQDGTDRPRDPAGRGGRRHRWWQRRHRQRPATFRGPEPRDLGELGLPGRQSDARDRSLTLQRRQHPAPGQAVLESPPVQEPAPVPPRDAVQLQPADDPGCRGPGIETAERLGDRAQVAQNVDRIGRSGRTSDRSPGIGVQEVSRTMISTSGEGSGRFPAVATKRMTRLAIIPHGLRRASSSGDAQSPRHPTGLPSATRREAGRPGSWHPAGQGGHAIVPAHGISPNRAPAGSSRPSRSACADRGGGREVRVPAAAGPLPRPGGPRKKGANTSSATSGGSSTRSSRWLVYVVFMTISRTTQPEATRCSSSRDPALEVVHRPVSTTRTSR